ncbi:holocytochrome c synthase [Cadophora gregata]|uniref:holocytochrome c synthase n=1 Tax=Cadophora gregata TaxID=51156 RepID=UPI0026DAD110|nr:holocytochrome c synthase [Cadophora gregata]KAK0117524.1 holocytochrome c synthase [Cadophora gregata]KAK0122577.1 holocytochrome c synthase [Cadophora gregata f. sp. sojae]
MAHISTRKFIKWGDNPAGENTDTLVLTTAGKHFVDIRIYLPTSPSEPSLPSLAPLPLSRLEWGFAGTASPTPATYSSVPGHEKEIVKPAHTVWTHWVDNKTTEEVRDEGDMVPSGSGDGGEVSREVMEYGRMENPATGKVEAYEECWVDLEIGKVDGEEEFRSWVLRAEDEEGGVRGVIARVGVYIQGVLRRGEEFSVGRWMWDSERGWQPVVEAGRALVPRGMFSQEEFVLGQKLVGGDGVEWACVESFSWK